MTVHFSLNGEARQPAMPRSLPLTLGFLCPHNVYDRTAFSGSAYFAAQALSAHPSIRLKILGGHRPPSLSGRLQRKIFGNAAGEINVANIELSGVDAIVGLVASPLLDRLSRLSQVPYLHVTDATPSYLGEAYGWDISKETVETERRVASGAAAVVYSSQFMAQRGVAEFGPQINAVSVPFGVNLDSVPDVCPAKPRRSKLELLFVCSDWSRKGGDRVLDVFNRLRDSGYSVRLTVAGKMPERFRSLPDLTFVGYLDKNRARDARRLAVLYANADVLLLPSNGDCTPMVVAEAMSYGTPVVAANAGGIASLIAAKTGCIMGAAQSVQDWSDAVVALTSEPQSYRQTSQAAFDHAKSNLSWRNWADAIAGLCRANLTTAKAA